MDLTHSIIVLAASLLQGESPAGEFLQEEVESRSSIEWPLQDSIGDTDQSFVWIGTWNDLSQLPASVTAAIEKPDSTHEPEGFSLRVADNSYHQGVLIIGNDSRGALFGAGYFLRKATITPGKVLLSEGLEIESAPAFSLRGHQLGYRNTPNSYDAWDLDQWEQYYRDLIVFGANSIELVSALSNDRAASPHYPLPPHDMAHGMSRLAEKYDLDVWLWYPAVEGDYSDPAIVDKHLDGAKEFLRVLPRLDHLFIPGGDPGRAHPEFLIRLLKNQYDQLQEIHPGAGLWMSPQGYGREWMKYLIDWIGTERPAWLSGLVYGPGVHLTLREFRDAIPAEYPIRSYPDITHTFHCQYPVPNWDRAFALTEGREPINPRPVDQKIIFELEKPSVHGWLTYSEGCNDDVNKAVWSALAWDPEVDLEDVLHDYARYYLSPQVAEDFAEGLFALERNWRGSLAGNAGVLKTLRHFQSLEDRASTRLQNNWRFQMALYRAYYDAFLHRRLLAESATEEKALEPLKNAPESGSIQALSKAEGILNSSGRNPTAPELRAKVFELADALFNSIGLQLSVTKYQASAVNRGANLDLIDFPLNNRRWLVHQFERIRKLDTESERLTKIHELIHWKDPGPGGFYNDLGNPGQEPNLVRGPGFSVDPGVLRSPADDFELIKEPPYYREHPYRYSWLSRASTLHGTPVRLRFTELDQKARYRVRIVYPADRDDFVPKIRLTADFDYEIHPFISRPIPSRPLEFPIPHEATSDGELELQLNRELTPQGNGRGAQIAEVWLLKD